ncbi:MAG: ABC transporter permease [Bacteroidetes bacterium HGW-Bacteroidetes-17]|nr:MAG: ABC transporter permease [Bacteroidetes bacterium HGW-Bacteroidetes-17]
MLISTLGSYVLLMIETFKRPDKGSVFRKQLMFEFQGLGIESLGIVLFISAFTGGIVALQTAYNIDSPLIPLTTVGFAVRQSIVLEFSPTIISLILAGKVGSRIASEIGTMKVTEQIDALKIMGVNPANYLILPKITASMIINPFLIILSIFVSIFGGWVAVSLSGIVSTQDFITGIRWDFDSFTILYAIIKTIVFAFIITSVSGYYGYNTAGGALDVGKSSTKAVVASSIIIIIFDLILTQLLLV